MMENPQTRSFVRNTLPWIVAAGMLLVYLVTLDTAVTATSVWPLSRVSGLEWRPVFTTPLHYLVTLPVRWLPAGGQLVGLNFISALCAALSLALLARSVALLPHDRTQLQRDKGLDGNSFLNIRLAWVPVLFAVAVCGLQRTLWEHAILNTGEALDLLLFAYSVRCLLEYRLEENTRWLYKLAVVYGLGITNNFALIAFFPMLLGALIWIKGLRFFRFDFLVRMFLLGLAGLSLYLLLPLIQSQSDIVPVSFWQALKTNLTWQKHLVLDYRKVAVLPAIYVLVPLLFMCFRWAAGFGDHSPVGHIFANTAAILLHAGLLAFCVYIAFDPPASPREISTVYRQQLGLGLFFLPCYWLGALMVGYYSGFLLLVFSGAGKLRQHLIVPSWLRQVVVLVVCAGALFATGWLVRENLPAIRLTNSRALQNFAALQGQSLPDQPTVVLSDNPVQLRALAAVLGRAARDKYILLDTASLPDPAYHRALQKRYGERFPRLVPPAGLTTFPAFQLIQLLSTLGQKNELAYLQPSFGYYFEDYYSEPRQLVYLLKPYAPGTLDAPPPSPAVITGQQTFWNSLAAAPIRQLKTELARLPADRSQHAEFTVPRVAEYYSLALNSWGVELQRAGRFNESAPFFSQALALNADNAAALINRDANALWVREQKRLGRLSPEEEKKLNLYRGDVRGLLISCGLIDEASFALEFSNIFIQAGLYRQAEQMIQRALFYAPGELMFQTALANIYVLAQKPDRALAMLPALRARATDPAVQLELMRTEASAHLAKNEFMAAEKILQNAARRFSELDGGYNLLVQLYLGEADRLRGTGNGPAASAQLTNALRVVDSQLQVQPQNAGAYFNRGNICLFVSDFDGAIQAYTKVLALSKDNQAALKNRAIANLQAKRLDDAQRDYRELLQRFTTTDFAVYFGLGEIAYQRKEWKATRNYYQKYLQYAPAGSQESKQVRARLEEVKKKA